MIRWQKPLFLSPHTDDAELWCGGTMVRMIEERLEVYHAVFSTCGESVPAGLPFHQLKVECHKAMEKMKLDQGRLIFFNFKVRYFSDLRQNILEELVGLRMEIQPDVVFIPASTDIHQDHQVIHNEAVRAFTGHADILGYEVPMKCKSFQADMFIKLNAGQLATQRKAIAAYESQAMRSYCDVGYIEALAWTRGKQAGCMYAEAFEVVRLTV